MVAQYHAVQLRETKSFLRRSLENVADQQLHVRQLFTATIVQIVYGRKVENMDDEYLTTAQKAVEGFAETRIIGKFWAEYYPFQRHLPSWFPGGNFKQVAGYYRPFVDKMVNMPFEATKTQMVDGTAPDSVARNMILGVQDKYAGTDLYEEYDVIARNVAGVAYAAGTDTVRILHCLALVLDANGPAQTTTAAQWFLIAASLDTELQRKAQTELDNVVGQTRLPDMEDLDSLDYIKAIALESLRWKPVLPLGIEHMVITDDEYEGYLIPEGTIVVPNAWAMLHDPVDYPSPEEFKPERFLKNGKLDPTIRSPVTIAFGFGRRICPGRHLALNSLTLFVASVLHVYDIKPHIGENGEPLSKSVKATSGVLSIGALYPGSKI
ncbi:hypothetical protein NLI96_g3706 [Meripilus lineatus]|uniref:Cytochrome P450 n=1 Tax=Meripilus lineatus TaxID=2056292 RepID=A0AAD5YKL0_9APHY|nr:hypothetical protein NLI96_g3706 [Physisporinus lineatus]